MQYYCLELTRALCCLSFLSGSSLSCKQIYHKQILPTARSSNSVKHCSEATQKKCRKICYLPTKHVLIWFLGRIQQPNRFHLPTISVLSKAEGLNLVRTRGVGQAEAHQCCPPAPQWAIGVMGFLSDKPPLSPSSYMCQGQYLAWAWNPVGALLPGRLREAWQYQQNTQSTHTVPKKTWLEKDDVRAIGQPVLAETKTQWPSSEKQKDL